MPNWTNEQKKAIELDNRSILVSAGAGSGKTAVLTERVINKIRKGVKINQLLILTFTKAAALEMKERIRAALENAGNADSLMLLDSSYITTFDSFALAIVKRYHYLLGIGNNIQITPSCIIDVYKHKIIDEIFDEYYQEKNDNILNILKNYCFKDDQNLKDSIYEISEKLDQLVDKENYLKNYFDDYNERVKKQIDSYNKVIIDKVKNIELLFFELLYYCEGKTYDEVLNQKNNLMSDLSIYNIKSRLDFELPRKNKECGEEYTEIKSNIKKLSDELKKELVYESYEDFQQEVDKTLGIQKFIVDVVIKLEERIKKYKESHSLFTFYDIAKKAIEVVKNNYEVRIELQEEFNEIMIDEYQDTSDIQEEFISLISKNNVYMVGDMKQSIYGFRNANPELFKYKYLTFGDDSAQSISTKIDLLHNFRSRKDVVDAINGLFVKMMDLDFGGVDYKNGHIMNQGNHSYDILPDNIYNYPTMFNLEVLDYSNIENGSSVSEKEAFIVCKDILKKIKNNYKVFDKNLYGKGINPYRNVKYSDFAILIDRTRDFDLYKKVFEYFNVPLQIYKDDSLLDGNNIILICNILKFINKISLKDYNNEFKYLYTSIARSFLYSLEDDLIFDDIKNNKIFDTVIYIKANNIIKDINTKTFKDLIISVINEFEFYEKIHLIGNVDKAIAEVEYLLSLAEVVNHCDNNLSKFVEFIDDILKYKLKLTYSYQVGKQDGVKIMTIHKSKGLEFPVIYCAGLSAKFNESEIKSSFLFDKNVGFICPYYEFGLKDTFLKNNYIYKYKYDEISEKIRLFYVMLTRAKEKIIFVTDSLDNAFNILPDHLIKFKINSFNKIINYAINNVTFDHQILCDEELEISDDYKKIRAMDFNNLKGNFSCINVIERKNNEEKIIKQRFSKNSISLDNHKTKKIKNEGIEVHYILENINFNKALNDSDYLNKVLGDSRYKNIIRKFFKLDVFKDLNNPKFYNEFEFSYIDNLLEYNGIIDLLINCDDKIIIIDYKLKDIKDQEYIKQLKGYSNYIKNITNKKVICYLYSIVDGIIKEI